MSGAPGRLVYVMGPSGAGKDSLLAWVGSQPQSRVPVHLARRTITRPVRAGDEQHHSVDEQAFDRLRQARAFALDWRANGLCYGVQHAEVAPLDAGSIVIVNGSRGYLPQALALFPEMTVVHVTAGIETLRARLGARSRETAEMVDARIQRALEFHPPPRALEIRNDGELADAGARLLQLIERL